MNQELLFAKTLEEIKELALEQNRVLSKEQVEEAFGKIGMKPEELTPIYDPALAVNTHLKKSNLVLGIFL